MEMNIKPIFNKPKGQPIVIAGPCSAESEEQILKTAHALAAQNVDAFRAGIWKPRTRPNCFEGVGVVGLKWLKKVKEETGLKVTTEVANKDHVFEALKHGIDIFWLGARTTVNPFSVQEIADALKGTDVPVMIKNPINPDLSLWLGGVERIYNAGITRIAVIHRGFSSFGESRFRNDPRWQIPIELKRRFPDLEIICDNSHICGRRDILSEIAQEAMDLNFDGVMSEVHPNPDEAWSDAKQQITPDAFKKLVDGLVLRSETTDNREFIENIEDLRSQIDSVDNDLVKMLSRRMKLSDNIGRYKKKNNISILQTNRWNEILDKSIAKGKEQGLSEAFMAKYLKTVHQESIDRQNDIMNL